MTSIAGLGALVRLDLRRDRVRLTVWVLALVGFIVSAASSVEQVYPTVQSRLDLTDKLDANPALLALYGKAFDPTSVGGFTAWRYGSVGAVIVAVMAILAVTRHTRAEEEQGRLELIGSTVVGRYAALTAALTVATGASLAVGLLVGLGLVGGGMPAGGAFALGLGWAFTGWVFAAVAAVAAQLAESTRTATGIALGTLAAFFLLRAVGDTARGGGLSFLSWLSPLGWQSEVRPFAQEQWWVLGLLGALGVVMVAAAYLLVTRRDVGAGVVAPRPGPAQGRLRGPFALAFRLHRGVLLGWAAGSAATGVALGSVAKGVGDFVGDSKAIADLLERLGGKQGLVDAYLATSFGVFSLAIAAYAIQATLRMRTEETAQRAEPLLATGVGRIRWAASHLVCVAFGSAVLLAVLGASTGIAHGLRTGEVGTQTARLTGGALAQLPSVLVIVGVSVAFVGLLPRLSAVSWGALTVCLLIGQVGPVLQVRQWVLDLSPFTHAPRVPGGDLTVLPLVVLVGLAAVLTALGLAGLRRRDIG